MKLSLSTIRTGAMASLLALSAISCTDISPKQKQACDKAENEAAQFLTGEEYLQAKSIVDNFIEPSIQLSNNLVNYWDSINTEYKVKRAYLEGTQMIQDSVAGKEYSKPNYSMPIRSYIKVGENGGWNELDSLLDNVQKQVATNTDGLSAKELLTNQPPRSDYQWPKSYGFAQLHYWNEIISVGKQRKAFDEGANAERAKLNK